MKVTERKIEDYHEPELQQLLDEMAHATGFRLERYGDMRIVPYLYLCRYPDGADSRPKPIKPTKQLPWPNPLLGSKLSKYDGTEVFMLINELASFRNEQGDMYLDSTIAAAINKLCTSPKKKKRR